MDGGAWWAAVHGVAKSWTRLSNFTFFFTFMHWRRKWQPTPVFLPGESQGRGEPAGLPSMGSHRVGHDWSDLAAAAAAKGYLYCWTSCPGLWTLHVVCNSSHLVSFIRYSYFLLKASVIPSLNMYLLLTLIQAERSPSPLRRTGLWENPPRSSVRGIPLNLRCSIPLKPTRHKCFTEDSSLINCTLRGRACFSFCSHSALNRSVFDTYSPAPPPSPVPRPWFQAASETTILDPLLISDQNKASSIWVGTILSCHSYTLPHSEAHRINPVPWDLQALPLIVRVHLLEFKQNETILSE